MGRQHSQIDFLLAASALVDPYPQDLKVNVLHSVTKRRDGGQQPRRQGCLLTGIKARAIGASGRLGRRCRRLTTGHPVKVKSAPYSKDGRGHDGMLVKQPLRYLGAYLTDCSCWNARVADGELAMSFDKRLKATLDRAIQGPPWKGNA